MATALVNVTTEDTDLVTAQAGKIVRLLRLVVGANASLTVKSGSTALLPVLKCGLAENLDLAFRPGDVSTARGEALRAQAAGSAVDAWLVYDVVD